MTESAGKGVFIYHEYNSTTWAENVTLDEDIFKVPDICLSSTTKGGFPRELMDGWMDGWTDRWMDDEGEDSEGR